MKKLLLEYLRIIAYTVTGLIFGLAFFLLFLNFYHYKELNTTYTKSDTDLIASTNIKNDMAIVTTNISTFDMNTYVGKDDLYSLASVKSRLELCVKNINNEEALALIDKKTVNIQDVYRLQQLYQTNVANECLVKQLYDLTPTDGTSTIKINSLNNMAPFFKDDIDELLVATTYIQSSIKNNSSYTFSSDSAKLNILDPTKDSYFQIVSAYQKASTFVKDVSNWFKKVAGGEL